MEHSLSTESPPDEDLTERLSQPGEEATRRLPGAAQPLVLGRYRLETRLGAGGHGVVWLARDEKLEREVALKVMPRAGGGPGLARAEREARVAARMNHPGIVALFEFAGDEESVYLVTELVRGSTYAELLRGGAFSDRDVARIGVALCDALDHAHRAGVVHRDVKPSNVMVLAEPAAGAGFAKLTDFGVAHLGSDDPLTLTGDVLGTLEYMAPEQAEGRRVTPAVDVYALALTLYEGWTGVNPVRGHGPADTARRLGRPLPPLRSRRRDLPPELSAEIDAALDPVPEERPTLRELRRELERAAPDLEEEGGLVEPATLERFGLMTRRARPYPFSSERRPAPSPLVLRVVSRLLAGAAAGGLVLAAVERLGPEEPFGGAVAPAAVAVTAALLVALLPRVGWLAAGLALVGWLASPDADRPGTAAVVAAAVVVCPLLLPRAGLLWSVPVAAPLLGALALGPAFVAIAGLASTAWQRAGLAVAGFAWLLAGEALAGESLLFGVADGTAKPAAFEGSLRTALADVYEPLFTSAVPLVAVAWALLAVALPFMVRPRSLALMAAGAAVWAVGLALAHAGAADLLAGAARLNEARGAIAGAMLAAVVAAAGVGSGLPSRTDARGTDPRMVR